MKLNQGIQIGVIADDFTGAGDAASFLVKGGAKTMMYTEVPEQLEVTCDAVVLALKSRSVSPKEAIRQTKSAADFLIAHHCKAIYFKYCSTFDSTPDGNIGIVADFLLEYLDLPYTLLCPSLPVNGRTVKEGALYVYGIKLSESPMKHHPLNPMWDSYLPALMKPQSKYPCFILKKEDNLSDIVKLYTKQFAHFYLIPDYENDEDGRWIAEQFSMLSLYTGGSGLLQFLIYQHEFMGTISNITYKRKQKAIILCGSCSAATKRQVEVYRLHGGYTYAIDSKRLLQHTLVVEDIYEEVMQHNEPVLIYSDAIHQNMEELKLGDSFILESKQMEELMARLSHMAVASGIQRIIVAGGETSGAVMLSLGFHGFYIGESIDPGIPALIPIENPSLTLILKSGNFGSDQFFLKAASI